MPLTTRFVEILADTGVSHGLVGPREVPRMWERHVLNCAVIEAAFPHGASIIDVGSGAGLPGVAIAVVRPDLEVHCVEPMQRRVDWLNDTVAALGVDNVQVHRGRAEEFAGRLRAPWVTARAVARTKTLAQWCVPLIDGEGTLVAMKGRSAQEELEQDRRVLDRLGLVRAEVGEYGTGVLDTPTLTLNLTFSPDHSGRRKTGGRPESRKGQRRARRRGTT